MNDPANKVLYMVGVDTLCQLCISAGLVEVTPIVGISVMTAEGLSIDPSAYPELEAKRIEISKAVVAFMLCPQMLMAINDVRALNNQPTGDV